LLSDSSIQEIFQCLLIIWTKRSETNFVENYLSLVTGCYNHFRMSVAFCCLLYCWFLWI